MIDFRIRRVESRHRDGTVFISPKTVSVHVSALLRKFGVSGRGDLSAAVRSDAFRPLP
jgi:hypothetical protein